MIDRCAPPYGALIHYRPKDAYSGIVCADFPVWIRGYRSIPDVMQPRIRPLLF